MSIFSRLPRKINRECLSLLVLQLLIDLIFSEHDYEPPPVELWRPVVIITPSTAPVAQLDRVTASEAVGCAFEPRRAHFNYRINELMI